MSVEKKATVKENVIKFLKFMHKYAGDYFSGQKWKFFDEQKTR